MFEECFSNSVGSGSLVAKSCGTLVTPWSTAHQAPPFMGFSRQGYWSGVPLPSLNITQSNIKFKINGAAFTVFIIIKMVCNKGFFPSFPLEQSHHVAWLPKLTQAHLL